MIKLAIGGPPHSGKSVLVGILRSLLPIERFAAVEAAPDGEGVTDWSVKADPELVKAVRRKGKFLAEYVAWVIDSVRHSSMPITLADLGGMLLDTEGNFSPEGCRLTPQNEAIMRECTHFLCIASPRYQAAAQTWLSEARRVGAEPLVVLESVLEGADDEIFQAEAPMRARVTKLDRNNPPVGSPTAAAVARLINSLAGEGTETDGSESADINFPLLAEGLKLQMQNGGSNREWLPGILPGLISFVQTTMAGRNDINLWGNPGAGFPYHALACQLSQRVRYYDPKVPGYVALPEAEPAGAGSVLDWCVSGRDGYSLVEFVIARQILAVGDLPKVIPPAVPAGQGIVISGKGPWWLTGTLCRAYHRAGAAWTAVFAPRESARVDETGRSWSERHPNLVPTIVVGSHDESVPVGTVIPFQL